MVELNEFDTSFDLQVNLS